MPKQASGKTPRPTDKNLKPQSERTKEEQRKIAKQGGIASGEARRRKKTMKEEMLALLDAIDEKSGKTNQENISLALLMQARRGNTKAYEIIRDTIGEKEPDNVNLKGDISTKVEAMTAKERQQRIKELLNK